MTEEGLERKASYTGKTYVHYQLEGAMMRSTLPVTMLVMVE